MPIEIDTTHLGDRPVGDGQLTLTANGGQKFTVRVTVEVVGRPSKDNSPTLATPKPIVTMPAMQAVRPGPAPIAPLPTPAAATASEPTKRARFLPAFLTVVLLCLAIRITLVPIVDWYGRGSVSTQAIVKLNIQPTADSPFVETGGWLNLHWLPILAGADGKLSANVFQPGNNTELSMSEFRHYFASYFIRWFVLRLWWVGAVIGVLLVLRRGGGMIDSPWGLIAGAGAGFAVAATLAAIFLVVEMIPHMLWHMAIGPHGGVGYLMLWSALAVFCWLGVGIVMGFAVPWFAPLRRVMIYPFQGLIASAMRLVGLRRFADYWTLPGE